MQQTKENEDFIFSTQYLMGEGKKYEFSFYLMILLECFATKYNQRHFVIFQPDKIEKIGNLPEKNIRVMNNVLGSWAKKPDNVLKNIREDKKDLYAKYLYGIILFFIYNFKKEETQNLLKSESMKPYLNKVLIYYSSLFKNIKLTKEQLNNLIVKSKNFEDISKALQYCDGVLDLIETISDDSNFQRISAIYEDDKSKKKPSIDIESITSPKLDDNIKEICDKYKTLLKLQKDNLKSIFINFKSSLCDKYIGYYEKINIDNLLYIKELIEFMKSNVKDYKVEKNINKIIHETGLELSQEHKLKNIEILKFIHII